MKTIRFILLLLAILAAFTFGWLAHDQWIRLRDPKPVVREQADVLLEKISQAAKLITVEGYFSEIYSHEEFDYVDVAPLRKKALIRVRATVSAGFDLGQLSTEVLPDKQVIRLYNYPQKPEILAIEHDLDYYDLYQGVFNSFSEADFNYLNSQAKGMIREKALETELLAEAESRATEWLEVMRVMVEESGWKLEVYPAKRKVTPFHTAD